MQVGKARSTHYAGYACAHKNYQVPKSASKNPATFPPLGILQPVRYDVQITSTGFPACWHFENMSRFTLETGRRSSVTFPKLIYCDKRVRLTKEAIKAAGLPDLITGWKHWNQNKKSCIFRLHVHQWIKILLNLKAYRSNCSSNTCAYAHHCNSHHIHSRIGRPTSLDFPLATSNRMQMARILPKRPAFLQDAETRSTNCSLQLQGSCHLGSKLPRHWNIGDSSNLCIDVGA